MPDLDANHDEDLEDEETEETEDGEESTEETEETEVPEGDAKRVRDLQSKADKATAKANQLEKELKALRNQGKSDGSNDPEQEAIKADLREAALDAVFAQMKELTEFGIERSLIEGGTRAQIRENAESVVALIKSVSTKTRNRVLKEHGIEAPGSGTKVIPPRDYGAMSDEEFLKLLER
jgi:hypothetical protein